MVVFLLGAGSTVADVTDSPRIMRPPLDKGFFRLAHKADGAKGDVREIAKYMSDVYSLDLLDQSYDSLERTMSQIYTDVFDIHLTALAFPAFRRLVRLFNQRLAVTTNAIPATTKRAVYRMVCRCLRDGVRPDDITVVTFNYDIQAEKILQQIEETQCWASRRPIFSFPYCYMLQLDPTDVTAPSSPAAAPLFPVGSDAGKGIKVLKLHGSLNWYSVHRSEKALSMKAMFRTDRRIRITRRRTLDPAMRLSGGKRSEHTLPLVVPPVTHKSGILHEKIKAIWVEAESRLKSAHEVVVFGYSCPELDFESSNLLRRSLGARRGTYRLTVVDPDSRVLKRYADLLSPSECIYYPTARDYLEAG